MNLELVYQHILSLSKNENMIKKTHTKQPKKKEKSCPQRESNPGPFACEVDAVFIAHESLC